MSELTQEIAQQLGAGTGADVEPFVRAWHHQLERAVEDDEKLAELVREREQLAAELPAPWDHVVSRYPLARDHDLGVLALIYSGVLETLEHEVWHRLIGEIDPDRDDMADPDSVMVALERRCRQWRIREGVSLPDLPPKPDVGSDEDYAFRKIHDYLLNQAENED